MHAGAYPNNDNASIVDYLPLPSKSHIGNSANSLGTMRTLILRQKWHLMILENCGVTVLEAIHMYDDMIGCDNFECKIQRFHWSCVKDQLPD